MAYTAPTAAELKAKFPAFAAVDDTVVNAALSDAARMVDESWLEGDFKNGRMLYAAHTMTLDGHGTGSDLAGYQMAGLKSIQSGSLSATFDNGAAGGGSSLATTSYGRRFLELLRVNRGGPLTT
jgi:hypothetical protein